ncbi:MAG TPA: hypothetical protein VFA10_14340 [Ktedonobacteraceae bacterium]|nr:hypothetical protein [Ktedonobacteraceae bacterium]
MYGMIYHQAGVAFADFRIVDGASREEALDNAYNEIDNQGGGYLDELFPLRLEGTTYIREDTGEAVADLVR